MRRFKSCPPHTVNEIKEKDMTYEFAPAQIVGDKEHWTTLPAGAHPWEYAMRFVERDLDREGWDGVPRLILAQTTEGETSGLFTLVQVGLPDEAFRENPMIFLGVLLTQLQDNPEVRDYYRPMLGNTPISGLMLAFEGHGLAGTEEEIAAAKAGGGRLADNPLAIENRVLTGIPMNAREFYSLIRNRGSEPEFRIVNNPKDLFMIMTRSRSHQLGVGLMLEFRKIQEEAKA